MPEQHDTRTRSSIEPAAAATALLNTLEEYRDAAHYWQTRWAATQAKLDALQDRAVNPSVAEFLEFLDSPVASQAFNAMSAEGWCRMVVADGYTARQGLACAASHPGTVIPATRMLYFAAANLRDQAEREARGGLAEKYDQLAKELLEIMNEEEAGR